GNNDLLPKGDFIIYKANCHVYVGDPIAVDDDSFGTSYAERTKKISSYFKDEFTKIRLKAEDVDYFKQKLFLNFLYKENGILKTVKNDFKQNKSIYHQLFYLISDKATIAHVTNDFGQLDFMLVNQFPSRKVHTYNLNEENRSIAKASYINQKFKIKYADDLTAIWQNSNILLLSHLQQFNENIPQNIKQIVVVCCKFKPNFSGFTQT